MNEELRVGVSACLLGEIVRYDGADERSETVVEALPRLLRPAALRWVPVCPEVEAGMGVPREPVALVGTDVRMVGLRSARDWTDDLRSVAARRLADGTLDGIAGYIFKGRSPSCGLASTRWHREAGDDGALGRRDGLFAEALRARWPELPVVEAEALTGDPAALEAFAEALRRGLAARTLHP